VLAMSCVCVAQDQDYRRVDGYLFDDNLQRAATEGRGPISDMVDRRMESIESAMNERMESRLRDAIPDLAEIRERTRLVSGFGERFDRIEQRWTPLQNLVDRLIGLIWKLIYAVVLLAVLVGFVVLVGLFLYAKIMRRINPVASILDGNVLTELIAALKKK
jgi:hypothetical protein